MTKKQLQERVEELSGRLWESEHYKEKYNIAQSEIKELEETLNKREGSENGQIKMMGEQIMELKLKINILTMTPKQIETMSKVTSEKPSIDKWGNREGVR